MVWAASHRQLCHGPSQAFNITMGFPHPWFLVVFSQLQRIYHTIVEVPTHPRWPNFSCTRSTGVQRRPKALWSPSAKETSPNRNRVLSHIPLLSFSKFKISKEMTLNWSHPVKLSFNYQIISYHIISPHGLISKIRDRVTLNHSSISYPHIGLQTMRIFLKRAQMVNYLFKFYICK